MSLDNIPLELLTEFFALAAVNNLFAPVTISHVCNKWRKVAISDPSLWTTIRITSKRSKDTLYSFTKTFLDRSKCLPLSITLDDLRGVDFSDIITLLAEHSFRWKSLQLLLCGINSINALLRPSPALQHISISAFGLEDTEFSTLARFLKFTSSISYICLDFNLLSGEKLSSLDFSNSYDSLTDLILKNWRPTPLLAVLCHCVCLQNLTLMRLASDDPPSGTSVTSGQSPPPVDIPNLRTIDIFQSTLDSSICVLFDNLTCPHLSDIQISAGFVDNFRWPNESFISFLRRSACPLTSLLLEMTQITEDQLIECLEVCSNTLESLDVIEPRDVFCVQDKLLRKLTAGTEHHNTSYASCTTLCPKLRAFQVDSAIHCQNGTLAAFLRSRQPSNLNELGCDRCVPLEKASIQIRKRFREDVESDIVYLKENGYWLK